MTTSVPPDAPRSRTGLRDALCDRAAPVGAAATRTVAVLRARGRDWAADPERVRRAGAVVLPVLVVVGLLLPPVSIVTRLTTIGYTHVSPGGSLDVPSNEAGTTLRIERSDIARGTRIRVRATGSSDLPAGTADLPEGHQPTSAVYQVDVRGPAPRQAWLTLALAVPAAQQAFVDPYGWDGAEWRWLAPRFTSAGRVQVRLPLARFAPEWVVVTRATGTPTEVSATLLPPPSTVPAAMAELGSLELRAYHLHDDGGAVGGEPFALPSRTARRFGVVDNLDGERVRSDLIDNVLIRPSARQRHRQAIVDIVQRDRLAGIVLDHRDIAPDLVPAYIQLVEQLDRDLAALRATLAVAVPMPQQTASGWTSGSLPWQVLGESCDALRVRLPAGAPLQTDAMDSLVRWALTQVDRRRLQLAVPVQGRDGVEGEVVPIGFGEALGRILDLAASDAPARITPGAPVTVDLPTVRAAGLARDPATGMWRFRYWDANRREHTVWLSDAEGLQPAFDIAAVYHLGQIVLDGVSAGLDPSLWALVRAFREGGAATAPSSDYRLLWRLADADGAIVQETTNALDATSVAFAAPREEGTYRLSLSLVTADGRLAALGRAVEVRVAPAPPPTPRPTEPVFYVVPTPIPYQTAPAPADEARARRTPVRVGAAVPTTTGTPRPSDARVAIATAALREGPGTGFAVLSDLKPGDELEVAGRTADRRWLQVRLVKSGLEGWVLAETLEVTVDVARVPVIVTPTPTTRATARP